jgi:beta-lactamase class A
MAGIALVVAIGALGLETNPASARRHPAPTATPATPVPTPVPTATPLSEAIRLERLPAALDAIAAAAPGRLGISVYDLYRSSRIAVRGSESFPLASVFKIAVAVAVYRMADQRKLDLNDRVLVTAADLRHGTSAIAEAHPRGNATYTYWQLIRSMLVDGDNTACDYLLRVAGGPSAVQQLMGRLSFGGLKIRKSEADLYADERAHRTFARGGDNAGTPDDVANLLAAIVTQRAMLLDSTHEMMLDLSDDRTGPSRFLAGIPTTASLAHETGSSAALGGVTDATNDAGIITLPDGRRVILVAFLYASHADEATRDGVLAKVAQTVYDAYAP